MKNSNRVLSYPAIFVYLVYILALQSLIVTAQTPACSPLNPTIQGWARGTTVYYDVSGMPADVRDDIVRAFGVWNTANMSNGSNVSFQPSNATHAATLTVVVGNIAHPAQTIPATAGTTIVTATIVFGLNNTSF